MSKITLDPVKVTAQDFLRAFFQDDQTNVYYRFFSDKEDDPFPGAKIVSPICNYSKVKMDLKKHNELFRGVFFVVNGGGNDDKEVISSGSCTAQFMEIDDFPMDIQLGIINAFPLVPSIVVKTRKSLHTYWLLDDGDIHRFRSIQLKMIKLFLSDIRIQNESRVMRIPTFYHNKQDPILVEAIHFNPELHYSQDQIEEALDKLTFKDLIEKADLSEEDKKKALNILDSLKAKNKAQKKASDGILDEDGKLEDITTHRVDTMISLVSKLTASGLPSDVIEKTIIEFNNTRCKPPVEQKRLEREVFPAIYRWNNKKLDKIVADRKLVGLLMAIHPEFNYKWNDRGNGELFANIFKDFLRWNRNAKKWMYYDLKVWRRDESGLVASGYAKKLYDALMAYIPSIDDEDLRQKYTNHVGRLGGRKFRETMLIDARDKYWLDENRFDNNHYLLNLQNGVFDLKEFKLLEHNSEYYMSRICNVSYDESAKCDRWIRFINEIMEGDQDKIEYLQKIIGYSLTGETKEEEFYILYGKTTRNGKSTLAETIGYMLGGSDGYALSMNPETVAEKYNSDSSRPSSDLARLKYCRFLIAAEAPKKMILNVSMLKRLTGNDEITARFLNENDIQFKPQFKMFMNTNHLPLVTDDTIFSSNRLHVITFDKHLSEEEIDKNLKDELKTPESLSGIFNWCLEGLRKYYEEGLNPPECIKAATEHYKRNSDKVELFIEDCLEPKFKNNLKAGDVFDLYKQWCIDNGFQSFSKRSFFAELRNKNMLSDTGTMYKWVKGLKESYTERNVIENYAIRDKNSSDSTNKSGFDEVKPPGGVLPFK